MELRTIVKKWLQENDYDGLCNTDIECGCAIEDLMPCGKPGVDCEAGHIEDSPSSSDVDYFIVPGKG